MVMGRLRVLGFALAATLLAASSRRCGQAPSSQRPANRRADRPSRARPNPVAHTYTFTLRSFKITDTRSPHEDTDTVFAASAVAGGPTNAPPGKPMGDLNNGTYTVNFTVTASPRRHAGRRLQLQHRQRRLFQLVCQRRGGPRLDRGAKGAILAADAVGQEVAGELGGVLGLYVGANAPAWAIDKVLGYIFPSCDGVVAAADHMLHRRVARGADRRRQDDSGHGQQSGHQFPAGCGRNSHYFVSWSISG